MTSLEDELRKGLRARAQALRVPDRPALDRDGTEPHRHRGPRWLIAAACLALVMAGVVALALRPGGDPEPVPPVDSVVSDTTAPAPPVTTVAPSDIIAPTPGINGWVAVDAVQMSVATSTSFGRARTHAGSTCLGRTPVTRRVRRGRRTERVCCSVG